MSDFDQRWQRLVHLARQAPATEAELPPGFATRVVARAAAAPAERWTMERLAVRGFWAATACCAAAVAFNYFAVAPESPEEIGLDDPVAQVLEFS